MIAFALKWAVVLVGNLRLGHTDGVIRLRLAGQARAPPSWLHAESVRLFPTIGAGELRYNIVGKS